MQIRCSNVHCHSSYISGLVNARTYFVSRLRNGRNPFRCTKQMGIASIPWCCAERHVQLHSKKCTIQHAFTLILASGICVALVSNGHPAGANNVVRKQQSSTTYAAPSSNKGGRPGISVPEQVRVIDKITGEAQAFANAGAYRDAVDRLTTIVQRFPGLALTERARIRRAVLLYETDAVQQAIVELDDEEVALRGNAEVHAALAALLYAERPIERQRAELQWELATEFDSRYNDLDWVARERRWGPKLLNALDRFLNLK